MSRYVTDAFPIGAAGGIAVNTNIPCSSSNYYHYSGRTVKYIVLHYTGNDSDTAKANAKYFNSGSRSASAHYFVDNGGIYQSVKLHDSAWAVGGTKTYKHPDCRNLNSISMEMCCSGNGIVSAQTEENAAQLCAGLCEYLNIGADQVDTYVLRHWDVWDKPCPMNWTGSNNSRWNGFKARVKQMIKGESEEIDMEELNALKVSIAEMQAKYDNIINTMGREIKDLKDTIGDAVELEAIELTTGKPVIYDYIDKNMPEWAHEGVRYCVEHGIIRGVGDGKLGLDDKDLKYCTMIMRMMKAINK